MDSRKDIMKTAQNKAFFCFWSSPDMLDEGLRIEIEDFIIDANPDLINRQLPEGQYVSEARLTNARLLPFGMGEASLVFQLCWQA